MQGPPITTCTREPPCHRAQGPRQATASCPELRRTLQGALRQSPQPRQQPGADGQRDRQTDSIPVAAVTRPSPLATQSPTGEALAPTEGRTFPSRAALMSAAAPAAYRPRSDSLISLRCHKSPERPSCKPGGAVVRGGTPHTAGTPGMAPPHRGGTPKHPQWAARGPTSRRTQSEGSQSSHHDLPGQRGPSMGNV